MRRSTLSGALHEKSHTEAPSYLLSPSSFCCLSDDHQIYKWSDVSRDSVEVAKLPDDFIPTDLHWLLLGGRSSGGGKGSDTLLICSNDGRFIILNKSARVERSISAHTAAISSGRWSPDGAGLLTAAEDGVIKIWSRSGMLRSTVIQSDEAIRCARWAPTSTSIAFSQGGHISIKPLAANSKLIRVNSALPFPLFPTIALSFSPSTVACPRWSSALAKLVYPVQHNSVGWRRLSL